MKDPLIAAPTCSAQNNIIVRPYADRTHFIHLDDFNEERLARVGAAFLTLRTSPGNHQVWVAVSDLAAGEVAKVRYNNGNRIYCSRGAVFARWRGLGILSLARLDFETAA